MDDELDAWSVRPCGPAPTPVPVTHNESAVAPKENATTVQEAARSNITAGSNSTAQNHTVSQFPVYPNMHSQEWQASCPATAPRVLDQALMSGADLASLALLDAGATSGAAPLATHFDWAQIEDQGNGEVRLGKWGRLGYLSRSPDWECVPRQADGGGCPASEEDGDEVPDCDIDTGEGCLCSGPEPEGSDLVCAPSGQSPEYRLITKTKTRTHT